MHSDLFAFAFSAAKYSFPHSVAAESKISALLEFFDSFPLLFERLIAQELVEGHPREYPWGELFGEELFPEVGVLLEVELQMAKLV